MFTTTRRVELDDVAIEDDGEIRPVTRIRYRRHADDPGTCPFCRSDEDVEFVDEIGPGAEWRKSRFECECGAYGESVWTIRAGTIDRQGGA